MTNTKQSVVDLRLAKNACADNIYHLACFHAQQCAEKILKAFLVGEDKDTPKTHKLIDLFSLARPILAGLSEYEAIVVSLDRYYLPTRYPDALPGSLPESLPTKEDAERLSGFLKAFLV